MKAKWIQNLASTRAMTFRKAQHPGPGPDSEKGSGSDELNMSVAFGSMVFHCFAHIV